MMRPVRIRNQLPGLPWSMRSSAVHFRRAIRSCCRAVAWSIALGASSAGTADAAPATQASIRVEEQRGHAPAGEVIERSVVAGSRTTDVIEVPIAPGDIRVVAIALPPQLAQAGGTYEFIHDGTLTIVGRLAGTISAGATARPVVVSVAVPTGTPSGRVMAGVLQYECASPCTRGEIELHVDVQPRSGLSIVTPRALLSTRAGARVRTSATVFSTGNADDSVVVSVHVPAYWRARFLSPHAVVLPRGAARAFEIEITLPPDASSGDYGMLIRASGSSGATAEVATTVRIIGGSGSGASGAMLLLTSTARFMHQPLSGTIAAMGTTIGGELLPGVRADGRIDHRFNRSDTDPAVMERALGRHGFSGRGPFLNLDSEVWNASAGSIGRSVDNLVGGTVWGTGFSASVATDEWNGEFFLARPRYGSQQGSENGHYAVASAGRRFGTLNGGLMVADLDDGFAGGRHSRTVGAEVGIPWKSGAAHLQGGHRLSDRGGSGFAWMLNGEQKGHGWGLNMRASHMPGGGDAFSRAGDEMSADAFAMLGSSLDLNASVWTNSSGSVNTEGRFMSDGWTFAPQLRLGGSAAARVEVRRMGYRGVSALGDFGNDETELALSFLGAAGPLSSRTGVSRGSVTRSAQLPGSDGAGYEAAAVRGAVFASISLDSRFGALHGDFRHERTGAGAGLPAVQNSVSVRAERVPLLPGRAYASAGMSGYSVGAAAGWITAGTAELDLALSPSYRIVLDVERNERLMANLLRRSSPWVISARFMHALSLHSPLRRAARGIVFRDVNGNGVMDDGERGLPGVVVTASGESITTDGRGRFDVSAAEYAQLRIDPRSLPAGWLEGNQTFAEAGSGRVQLPVVPTSSLEVEVRVPSVVPGDDEEVDVRDAIVVLTDSIGRRWTGVPDSTGVLRFDALPQGSYTVGADLSQIRGQLVLPDELPVARVGDTHAVIRVELILAPRPVRLTPAVRAPVRRIIGGSAGGGSGGAGGNPGGGTSNHERREQ